MRWEHLRTTGGPALAKVLLADERVAQLARLSLAMNQPHVHAAVLVSSVLLRVQSEAMGPWGGYEARCPGIAARWTQRCLGSLHIRLARRKHGPHGSLLVRTCACAGASPHTAAPCTQWRRCSVTRAPVRSFSTSQAPRSSKLSAAW